jgi:hypothetical protein
MTRLLSIALLASILGLAVPGAAGPNAEGWKAVASSQASGDSGEPMAGTGCGACAAMGACIAPSGAQCDGIEVSRLPAEYLPSLLSDQLRAPETAPPKRSCI